MSFAAPGFLWAGALAALGLVALHFLARREPEPWSFPTARFVPQSSERAPTRSVELSDRLLLLFRLIAVAAAALAFARPSFTLSRARRLQVIVADRSRAVGDTAEVSRAVAEVRRNGDVVIDATDGSLSAALLRAIREARRRRDAADSLVLVLVSPVAREEFDAATLAIRSAWPGGVLVRRVAAAVDSAPALAVSLRAAPTDPIRATLTLAGVPISDSAPVRLVREATLGAGDSAWTAGPGRRLVHWPAETRAAGDTIGAVATDATVLVAAFARSAAPSPGVPVAWWADGAVAATELPLGAGCVRRVAVPVEPAGDLSLRERFRDLTRDLIGPCGGARDFRTADSATMRALTGSAGVAVPAALLPPRPDAGRAAVPWLLLLALAALTAEQVARRRSAP